MVKFQALYYPSFEPPVNWLRSFLLFFDKISSIVPDDAKFTPAPPIAEIIDLIPDAFSTISPKYEDIIVDDINLSRMRKAFMSLKDSRCNSERDETKITLGFDGTISVSGQIFLHDSKMTQSVRDLLKEFKLIDSPLAEAIGARDFTLVDERAGDLIVSHVADNIGRRYGLNTITDHRLDFTVNALNAINNNNSVREPESLLACSIINAFIPQEIIYMSTNQYKQIRDAYSDIREPFHRVVLELTNLYRLNLIEDENYLKERINDITREFNTEYLKLKKSNFGQKVKRWTPIGIGGLASLTGAAFTKPVITFTSAAIGVAIQLVQEFSGINIQENERNNVQRLIGRMQKDILKASQVKKIV